MQEINTNQSLILAQLTSSKNGNRTFRRGNEKTKEEKSSKRQPFLQKQFLFSVINVLHSTVKNAPLHI